MSRETCCCIGHGHRVEFAARHSHFLDTSPWGEMTTRLHSAVSELLEKWRKERLEYPLDDARASVAFITVKLCEEELAAVLATHPLSGGGVGSPGALPLGTEKGEETPTPPPLTVDRDAIETTLYKQFLLFVQGGILPSDAARRAADAVVAELPATPPPLTVDKKRITEAVYRDLVRGGRRIADAVIAELAAERGGQS